MARPNLGDADFEWKVGMVCENHYGWQAEVRDVRDDAVIIGRAVFHLDGKPMEQFGGERGLADPGNAVKQIVQWS